MMTMTYCCMDGASVIEVWFYADTLGGPYLELPMVSSANRICGTSRQSRIYREGSHGYPSKGSHCDSPRSPCEESLSLATFEDTPRGTQG